MANITQVQNILEKAKHGQHVSINCQGDKTTFNGYVVDLKPTKVKAVKIEDWQEGWPQTQPVGPVITRVTSAAGDNKMTFDEPTMIYGTGLESVIDSEICYTDTDGEEHAIQTNVTPFNPATGALVVAGMTPAYTVDDTKPVNIRLLAIDDVLVATTGNLTWVQ